MGIAAHGGGELVDLRCSDAERPALLERAQGLRRLVLGPRELSDLELLANGGLSPLRGFLTEAECKAVVDGMTRRCRPRGISNRQYDVTNDLTHRSFQ